MTAFTALAPPEGIVLSVILPTRNERSTVAHCVNRLEVALSDFATEVIFVDDSDDGTESVIRAIDSDLSISVVHRRPGEREGGLATAVLLGMKLARGEYICVLDADLQHPPETIVELMRAARDGADVVIASRYIQGGSANGLAGALRVAASEICRHVARGLFPSRLRSVHDPLSGFFIVRREVVAGKSLRPVGFKILLEILVRGRWARVVEVPYAFEHRLQGASKASLRQGWLYLRHLSLLVRDRVSGKIDLDSGSSVLIGSETTV